jgi:succinate dehydrogenase / fumarate reductase flavoprotein subunit
MAEMHAKEAPDRVRELEGWGAVFDRTPDGRINQRNFGGHRYPRLAHVGDRTGLELIRTLQDHAVYTGMTVHMEHTVVDLILDNGRAAGVLAYDRERGRFHLFAAKAIVLATGGIGRAYRITSNSWEGTGDGHALAYRAGAELIDMEFIQFHPTGMVWPPSVRGILVTEGVRGEGGVLKNSEGRRFMFDDIPDNYKPQTASRSGRRLAIHAGRQERAASARAPDPRSRGAMHQPRGEGGRGSRTAASFSTSRGSRRRSRTPRATSAASCRVCITVQGAGRPRHHEGADGSRADDALRDGWDSCGRRHPDCRRSPACLPRGECASGITAPTVSAATRCRI